MKDMQLHLTLPLPISINQLYQNQTRYDSKTKSYIPTGKRILTQKGKMCKKNIQKATKKQIKKQTWDYEWTKTNFLYLDAIIYFNQMGRDDNNIYKLLCDSLEKICYDNDSRVLIRTQRLFYDSKDPKVEVFLTPVDYIGIFDSEQDLNDFVANCETCRYYYGGKCSVLNKAKEGRIQEEINEEIVCHKYTERKS